jgi:hypothetical protein
VCANDGVAFLTHGKNAMETVIAYWLLPAEPARNFFAKTIEKLAARFDAPSFTPHLTLFVASENPRAPAEVVSAIGIAEIILSAIDVRSSEQFTKTLFVQFKTTNQLQELSDKVCRLSGANECSVLDPHVSLLYQSLPEQTKQKLADSIHLPFREVTFASVCAMRCASPTQTTDDVRAWRLLAPQNSSTR